MKKLAFLAALFLSLSLFPVYATPHDDAFQKVAHDYVEQYSQANRAGD